MGEQNTVTTEVYIATKKTRRRKKNEDYDPDMDREYMLDQKCCCYVHYKKAAIIIGAIDAVFFFIILGLVIYTKIVIT